MHLPASLPLRSCMLSAVCFWYKDLDRDWEWRWKSLRSLRDKWCVHCSDAEKCTFGPTSCLFLQVLLMIYGAHLTRAFKQWQPSRLGLSFGRSLFFFFRTVVWRENRPFLSPHLRRGRAILVFCLLCWVHKVSPKTAKLGHRNSASWNWATAVFSKGCFVASGAWRLGQLYAKLVAWLASGLVTVEAWFQGAVPLETGSVPCSHVSSKHDNWWGTCNSRLLFLSSHQGKYDEEIEVYKHHLEQTYKLCRPCQAAVEYYIKHQNRQLRALLLSHHFKRRETDKAYTQVHGERTWGNLGESAEN